MMNYELTAVARQDIRDINRYTVKQWGKKQAIAYVSALYERFAWLNNRPYLGKKRTDIKENLMSYQEGSHIIFYRIEAQGHIAILRILHQRMDFKRHLSI